MLTVEQVLALADDVVLPYRAVVLLGAYRCLCVGETPALLRECARRGRPDRQRRGDGRARRRLRLGRRAHERRRTVTVPAAIVPDVRAQFDTFARTARTAGCSAGAAAAGCVAPRSRRAGHGHRAAARADRRPIPYPRHTQDTFAAATGASLADLMARTGYASGDAALRYQHATRRRDIAIAGALSDRIARALPA